MRPSSRSPSFNALGSTPYGTKRGEPANTDLIFPRTDGRPLNHSTLFGRWRRAIRRAGVPSIRFHDALHTHTTTFIEGNTDQGRTGAAGGCQRQHHYPALRARQPAHAASGFPLLEHLDTSYEDAADLLCKLLRRLLARGRHMLDTVEVEPEGGKSQAVWSIAACTEVYALLASRSPLNQAA